MRNRLYLRIVQKIFTPHALSKSPISDFCNFLYILNAPHLICVKSRLLFDPMQTRSSQWIYRRDISLVFYSIVFFCRLMIERMKASRMTTVVLTNLFHYKPNIKDVMFPCCCRRLLRNLHTSASRFNRE